MRTDRTMSPSKDGSGCEWVGVLCMLGRGDGTWDLSVSRGWF